ASREGVATERHPITSPSRGPGWFPTVSFGVRARSRWRPSERLARPVLLLPVSSHSRSFITLRDNMYMKLLEWLKVADRTSRFSRRDRRRGHGLRVRQFTPWTNGLEDRTLLSMLTVPKALTVTKVTDSPVPQPGELRYEINAAKLARGGEIMFQLPAHSTIMLKQGELPITTNLDIEGPGADDLTISGNDASRIFDISTAGTVVTIA